MPTFVNPYQTSELDRMLDSYKLDQETWLCRTHLDDFVDKNWTLLDHIRPTYTILDHFDNFGLFWTRYENFRKFFDHLNRFETFAKC